MEPTPAEIARTLTAGHLPARVRTLAGVDFAVRHVTDRMGRILLLMADGCAADRALRPPATDPRAGDGAGDGAAGAYAEDTVALFTVADHPPVAGGPWRGRLEISGWATRLSGAPLRRAALDFAEVSPEADLLDVGRGTVLYRLDLAEIRWTAPTPGPAGAPAAPETLTTVDVDVDAFLDAEPDPFAAEESTLLADLADHHTDLLDELCRQAREVVLPDAASARALRLDRYGLVLGVALAGDHPGDPAGGTQVAVREERWIRAGFRQPVANRKELAEIFHLLACCRCRHRPTD